MGIIEEYNDILFEEGEDAADFMWALSLRRERPEIPLGSGEYLHGEDINPDYEEDVEEELADRFYPYDEEEL